jgi:hypothetical protein
MKEKTNLELATLNLQLPMADGRSLAPPFGVRG